MAIELLDFQQKAAAQLVDTAVNYFQGGQDIVGGRPVPFVGQLKAVTGAGKTPILADVVSKLKPAIILWTTKYGAVVDQTVTNLKGKYSSLLGSGNVEVVNFSDIVSPSHWEYLIEKETGLTIIVSTVAGWNSSEKDERLNVHRPCPDWGERTRWDRLKLDRRRPLWVVYDEAHNTTTEQIELLDELNPAGFFVASASQIGGRLQFYLTSLPQAVRDQRIVPISTRAVVDAELLKSTISLADYESSADEMIVDVVKRRDDLQRKLDGLGSITVPKAIYVVETSNVKAKDEAAESRPTSIWRTLVNLCHVAPENIAVCTNTKDLPREATRVESIDQLSDDFTHIIFNKKLQEGWDDPSVYVCYFDGKTQSATRIQQVLGRAVRQPGAQHFRDEDLNTAYFFFNCPTELLEKITDQLKEELRIYQGDEPGFEPFEFKQERRAVPRIPLKDEWEGKLRVPNLQPEMPIGSTLENLIAKKTFDFSEEDRSARGRATISIVSVATGQVSLAKRNLLEDMRVRCGTYLSETVRSLSRNCCNAIPPQAFSSPQLDKSACYNSKALEHYREVAQAVVQDYENHVRLSILADPDEENFVVGPYQPSGSVEKEFKRAAHPFYDTNAFRPDELDVAKALDKFDGHVWVRNKDRLDYGIPLPVKSGTSSKFYPDFLWWVKETVWAIDPTGNFILSEKLRAKLLMVPAPLRIALLTKGQLGPNFAKTGDTGWSVVPFRLGNAAPENFESLDALLATLADES